MNQLKTIWTINQYAFIPETGIGGDIIIYHVN